MEDLVIRHIKTIHDFHDAVQALSNCTPIYRGVSDHEYQLISTIGRELNLNTELNFRVCEEAEQALLDDFKRRSLPYLKHIPKTDCEWLAIAQHYELPTRLLDWTRNPLVALYFSCNKNHDTDSAIYVLIEDHVYLQHNEKDSIFDIENMRIFEPKHTTQRVANQSSLFTIHPNPTEPFIPEDGEKWIISANIKIKLLHMAFTYGIDEAFLFPGLNGIAKSVKRDWV